MCLRMAISPGLIFRILRYTVCQKYQIPIVDDNLSFETFVFASCSLSKKWMDLFSRLVQCLESRTDNWKRSIIWKVTTFFLPSYSWMDQKQNKTSREKRDLISPNVRGWKLWSDFGGMHFSNHHNLHSF